VQVTHVSVTHKVTDVFEIFMVVNILGFKLVNITLFWWIE